jgi:hypothetical protein
MQRIFAVSNILLVTCREYSGVVGEVNDDSQDRTNTDSANSADSGNEPNRTNETLVVNEEYVKLLVDQGVEEQLVRDALSTAKNDILQAQFWIMTRGDEEERSQNETTIVDEEGQREEISVAVEEDSREALRKRRDMEEQRRVYQAVLDPLHEEAYPASAFLCRVRHLMCDFLNWCLNLLTDA